MAHGVLFYAGPKYLGERREQLREAKGGHVIWVPLQMATSEDLRGQAHL